MVKTKSKKVLGLIPTFVEVTGKKLVGVLFASPHPEQGENCIYVNSQLLKTCKAKLFL